MFAIFIWCFPCIFVFVYEMVMFVLKNNTRHKHYRLYVLILQLIFMRDKVKGVGRMSGDAGAFPECEVIH